MGYESQSVYRCPNGHKATFFTGVGDSAILCPFCNSKDGVEGVLMTEGEVVKK